MKVLVVDNKVNSILEGQMVPLPEPLPPNMKIVDAPLGVRPGYFYNNGTFTAPGPGGAQTTPSQNYTNGILAMKALVESDRVVFYCSETEVPVPQEWKDYRNTLRTIIAQKDDPNAPIIPLPPLPSLPAGMMPISGYGR
jgi:hypothetical protein